MNDLKHRVVSRKVLHALQFDVYKINKRLDISMNLGTSELSMGYSSSRSEIM